MITERAKQSGQKAINKVKDALRQPYAWPGGYPIQFLLL